jgi:uncharacterized protein YbbC (DUF1343 family)
LYWLKGFYDTCADKSKFFNDFFDKLAGTDKLRLQLIDGMSEEKIRQSWQEDLKKYKLEGFILRPLIFRPTFQKFSQETCGGFQIHITDFQKFRPWLLGQYLVKKLRNHLGDDFMWNTSPYEYEDKKLAIDLINGSNKIREWVESKNGFNQLIDLEQEGRSKYLRQRDSVLIYTKI